MRNLLHLQFLGVYHRFVIVIEIEIVHKGAIFETFDNSKLQYDTHLVNEVDVELLRHLHNNKHLQFLLQGQHNNILIPNTNKKIDVLTRSVRYGDAGVPNEEGQRTVCLLVKMPKDHMIFDFNDET